MWGAKPAAADSHAHSRLRRWAARLVRLAWMAVLAWLVMRKVGIFLRNPVPLCAWRFTTTSRSWMSLAWADAHVAHHAMLMYLNEGEEFKLESESLPYARLFSFQTFGPLGRHAHGEIKDHEITPQHGPNVFADISAAANGERQGGFRIHLTAQGNRNLTNEIAALGPGRRSGFFVLVFRVVDVGDMPHPKAPWAHLSRGAPEYPERWGWAPPPKLAVRRVGARRRGAWREIPQCSLQPRAELSLSFLDTIHDLLPSIWDYSAFTKANRKNNMHLQRAPLFAHRDTRSLASAADVSQIEEAVPDGDLWARVAARLPRTPRSLYSAPFIANHTDYDVRYVSFTSASRAFPLRSYHTLTDKKIRQHYQNQLKDPRQAWDGSFIVWIGPEGAPLPDQAKRENALVMSWGEKQGEGGPISFPALLYNQLLSQAQARDEVAEVDFTKGHAALADIVADVCPAEEGDEAGEARPKKQQRTKGLRKAAPAKEDDEDEDQEDEGASIRPLRERVCCGHTQLKEIPGYCFMPEFLHLRMRGFYPAVNFFIHQEADERGPAQLRKLSV